MDHCRVGRGVRIHRGIVDRYNVLEPGEVISATDGTREDVTVSGDLVVVPRGKTRPL
jgi:ADP-glucose pyrophosphorylase